MSSENFSAPGQCCVTDCDVALVVREENGDRTKLFACGHKLASLTRYFNTLLHGNFAEKNKKEVKIEGVSKKELISFLQWAHQHPKPLQVRKVESLYDLIFLADRFLCPTLEEQIVVVLGHKSIFGSQDKPPEEEPASQPRFIFEDVPSDDSDLDDIEVEFIAVSPKRPRTTGPVASALSELGVAAKLKLLKVAERHKGTEANVLEACIRRCADLEIDQVSSWHGKVSLGTLAAVYATIGRAKDTTCVKRAPIEISQVKRIRIDKNLLSS